ncbi:hypothetical protein F0L17_09910 [Streptomyces sp. TRM43335]|uniref:Protein kinase domain-containing protein n=1 Tax=Streptomyces taklimakanensis TaxID=2569853 RepID=A0A6G2BBD1_9ACTN|nr:hypothetical protein [Streptomyces taklimakanensis]MTE19436.1 hypothetical protein [Streptomyces taklimakanensis]
MTGTGARRVDVARLTRGGLLGRGGQGSVWDVGLGAPDDPRPTAFKEYAPACLDALDVSALEELVAFAAGAAPHRAEWIHRHAAWPTAVVTDGDRTVGFLMPRVPERFFLRLSHDPEEPRTAGVEYLLNSDAYLDAVGIRITLEQRLLLLRDLAATLARLHVLGVVVGDMSPKNLLFCLEPEPACLLIDCDAVRLRGRTVLPQAETVAWELPEGEELGTAAGDAHKFGLLAMRLIDGDQDSDDPSGLEALDPELGRLAAAARETDPERRPRIVEWIEPLDRAASEAARRPIGSAAPGADAGGPGADGEGGGDGGDGGDGANTTVLPRVGGTVLPPAPRRGRASRVAAAAVLVGALVGGTAIWSGWGSGDEGTTGGTRMTGDLPTAPRPEQSETGEETAEETAAETEFEQARALNGLLVHNSGTRSGVSDAVAVVQRCGGNTALRNAKGVFDAAARSRDDLVRRLDALDLDRVPGGESAAERLRDGWEHSAAADRAYARWTEDLIEGGCVPGRTSSSTDWNAAVDHSERATRAKNDFVAAWNPIAVEHGLREWRWDEL